MPFFYSKSTNGFYANEIHGDNIPQDAVEITDEQHFDLLNGQAAGQKIIADDNDFPVLVDYPDPTSEDLALQARAARNVRLAFCDWTVLSDAPLDPAQKLEWIEYRQALRDIPMQPTFPQKIDWPAPPKSAKKEK